MSQERERTISVSPKTRMPTIVPGSGNGIIVRRPSSLGGESTDYHLSNQNQPQPVAVHQIPAMKREGTPAKRKLEDRDLKPEELDGNHRRPPPPQMNGNHGIAAPISQSVSPVIARRKRARYLQPPVWAQSGKARQPTASRNYTLKSKNHVGGGSGQAGQVNGDAHASPTQPQPQEGNVKAEVKLEHVSRHNSPEVIRKAEEHGGIGPENKAWKVLDGRPFPVEPISLNTPFDHLVKVVADFLFQHICLSEFAGEIKSRGIQWEVEAKLGTIIDRNTNSRVHYPINGECALSADARVAFRSSMTLVGAHRYSLSCLD